MLDYVQDGEAMAAGPKQNALCFNLRVGESEHGSAHPTVNELLQTIR